MEDYGYKVIKSHAIQSQNISKFTSNISENTSKFTSKTDQIKVRGVRGLGSGEYTWERLVLTGCKLNCLLSPTTNYQQL